MSAIMCETGSDYFCRFDDCSLRCSCTTTDNLFAFFGGSTDKLGFCTSRPNAPASRYFFLRTRGGSTNNSRLTSAWRSGASNGHGFPGFGGSCTNHGSFASTRTGAASGTRTRLALALALTGSRSASGTRLALALAGSRSGTRLALARSGTRLALLNGHEFSVRTNHYTIGQPFARSATRAGSVTRLALAGPATRTRLALALARLGSGSATRTRTRLALLNGHEFSVRTNHYTIGQPFARSATRAGSATRLALTFTGSATRTRLALALARLGSGSATRTRLALTGSGSGSRTSNT